MSSCSSFREILEDQYVADLKWKILMQLRFQMSKIMLDFKKANNSIFKLLILKITKIYIYKTEKGVTGKSHRNRRTETKAPLTKYIS